MLARVGEGIVSSIGSAASHKIVLENPDSISRVVLEKGLDAGTAFEILSIDIADIDVGKNIGAQLQMDQAQADKNIAQAKAEERRAMAVALEQENKAKAQDARAKVILAEAEVPLAMAEAFRNGNLGIMDYYKMKNIMADTSDARDHRQTRKEITGLGRTAVRPAFCGGCAACRRVSGSVSGAAGPCRIPPGVKDSEGSSPKHGPKDVMAVMKRYLCTLLRFCASAASLRCAVSTRWRFSARRCSAKFRRVVVVPDAGGRAAHARCSTCCMVSAVRTS